jgi:hypothetical protein
VAAAGVSGRECGDLRRVCHEVAHGGTICANAPSNVTAAMTSDVIALPREAMNAEATMNWEEIR